MVHAAPGLLLIVTLVLLPLAAGASPPDPTWLAGIYDEADGDDVVGLVDDTVACKTNDVHAPLSLACLPDELIYPTPSEYGTSRTLTRDRGPPPPAASYTNSLRRSAPVAAVRAAAGLSDASWTCQAEAQCGGRYLIMVFPPDAAGTPGSRIPNTGNARRVYSVLFPRADRWHGRTRTTPHLLVQPLATSLG